MRSRFCFSSSEVSSPFRDVGKSFREHSERSCGARLGRARGGRRGCGRAVRGVKRFVSVLSFASTAKRRDTRRRWKTTKTKNQKPPSLSVAFASPPTSSSLGVFLVTSTPSKRSRKSNMYFKVDRHRDKSAKPFPFRNGFAQSRRRTRPDRRRERSERAVASVMTNR